MKWTDLLSIAGGVLGVGLGIALHSSGPSPGTLVPLATIGPVTQSVEPTSELVHERQEHREDADEAQRVPHADTDVAFLPQEAELEEDERLTADLEIEVRWGLAELPLANAKVRLERSERRKEASSVTDAAGKVWFERVPVGRVRVVANAEGFRGVSRWVMLTGHLRDPVVERLVLHRRSAWSVATPPRRAALRPRATVFSRANPSGDSRVAVRPAIRRVSRVLAEPAPTDTDNGSAQGKPEIRPVGPRRASDGHDHLTSSLAGIVLDESGATVPWVEVRALSGGTRYDQVIVMADAAGVFSFPALPIGQYIISARWRGILAQSRWQGDVAATPGKRDVRVTMSPLGVGNWIFADEAVLRAVLDR